MKNNIIIYIFCFLCPFVFCQQNDDIFSYIGNDVYTELKEKGEMSLVIRKKENLSLVPDIPEKNSILEKIAELDPAISVEFLSSFPIKNDSVKEKDFILLKIFNILHSVSTLKGISYYSESRKKESILYREAFTIENPETKIPVKDLKFHSLQTKSGVYSFFNDSSLGKYICSIKYFCSDAYVIMEMENETSINYMLVPIVGPKGLLSYLVVLPFENEIIVYGFSCLKITNFFGIADGKIGSLYNRIKAVYNWFQNSYLKYN